MQLLCTELGRNEAEQIAVSVFLTLKKQWAFYVVLNVAMLYGFIGDECVNRYSALVRNCSN